MIPESIKKKQARDSKLLKELKERREKEKKERKAKRATILANAEKYHTEYVKQDE